MGKKSVSVPLASRTAFKFAGTSTTQALRGSDNVNFYSSLADQIAVGCADTGAETGLLSRIPSMPRKGFVAEITNRHVRCLVHL